MLTSFLVEVHHCEDSLELLLLFRMGSAMTTL